jgi:hypothetical protein
MRVDPRFFRKSDTKHAFAIGDYSCAGPKTMASRDSPPSIRKTTTSDHPDEFVRDKTDARMAVTFRTAYATDWIAKTARKIVDAKAESVSNG